MTKKKIAPRRAKDSKIALLEDIADDVFSVKSAVDELRSEVEELHDTARRMADALERIADRDEVK